MLNNELYNGVRVWNRQRFVKNPSSGRRQARLNPESAWDRVPVPELRIIADDVWLRAKSLQRKRAQPGQSSGSNLNALHRPRYLLSGLLRCGSCGGPFAIVSTDRYGCANHRERGTCSSRRTVLRAAVERRVLDGLKERLLAPEKVKEFVSTYLKEVNLRNRAADERKRAARVELEAIGVKLQRLIRAVEDGVSADQVKERFEELGARKAALEAECALEVPATLMRVHPNAAELYRRRVADLEAGLQEPATHAAASKAIRALIDRIVVRPDETGTGVELELVGELAGLLSLGDPERRSPGSARETGAAVSLVAGRGFEPLTFRL